MRAGFKVVGCMDNDPTCMLTYLVNLGGRETKIYFVNSEDEEAWERVITWQLKQERNVIRGITKRMLKKSPLKRTKGLKKISDKQQLKQLLWSFVCHEKASALDCKCQWCGKPLASETWDGHHIIKRSKGRIDTPENCFVCHRHCHEYIERSNIKLKYPDKGEVGVKDILTLPMLGGSVV